MKQDLYLAPVDLGMQSDIGIESARLIQTDVENKPVAEVEYGFEAYAARLRAEGQQLYALIHEQDSELLAAVVVSQSALCQSRGWIEALVVSRSQRQQGYGRIALGMAAQILARQGVAELWLKPKSPSYYEQFGFAGSSIMSAKILDVLRTTNPYDDEPSSV